MYKRQTICYIITIITCFICNLAINHTLSWFWVVLASLLCAYSFVPTFTSFFSANKLLVFTITSLSSICLLLLVCAIFTGTIYWVSTACFGTAIGYAFLFVPILIHKSNVCLLYTSGMDETATFQRTVIKNSRNRCLVIPSSKVGVDSFVKVCDVDVFDSIITDWDCVEYQIAAIEEKGVEITVIEEPK